MRAMSLAFARPRLVHPAAHYEPRTSDGILVLQRGENASTDYYLRPRLQRAGMPGAIADLADAPDRCAMLGPGGAEALTVVFCRYASPGWLEALERARERLARVVLFMDDDLPAVVRDHELPSAARGKVALHFSAHAERMSGLCSELWVSSEVLAQRYAAAGARLLAPLPEAEPPEPSEAALQRVVYHGTDVHAPERRFVLEVARRVAGQAPSIPFEIVGDEALARAASSCASVTVVPQRPWADYLAAQAHERAAISLAPLFASVVNEARAPVKVFDAARLGAAGLYADAPAYRGFVRGGHDGLLLPMDPDAWAAAIVALAADPARRVGLAAAARGRLVGMLAADGGFPSAPSG